MSFDLIVRGGLLVTPGGVRRADMGVSGGQITLIAEEITAEITADGTELDARGLHVFPGAVDAHVHLNEPGRTDWEGFTTGTRALAAGGATTFLDMPLNSSPPVLNRERFEEKARLGEQKSLIDFGLWGGLTPLNLAELDDLADAGVIEPPPALEQQPLERRERGAPVRQPEVPRVHRRSVRAMIRGARPPASAP